MAKPDIQAALDAVDMSYDEIIQIVDDTRETVLHEVDALIQEIRENIQDMSNDKIRDTLMRLSLQSYTFSSIKDKAAFKASLAESLRKEAYAKAFGNAVGTVAQKDGQALLDTSSQAIAEKIHDLMADLFKTSLDEIHRSVDVLKTVLMSRLTEAKLVSNDIQYRLRVL